MPARTAGERAQCKTISSLPGSSSIFNFLDDWYEFIPLSPVLKGEGDTCVKMNHPCSDLPK